MRAGEIILPFAGWQRACICGTYCTQFYLAGFGRWVVSMWPYLVSGLVVTVCLETRCPREVDLLGRPPSPLPPFPVSLFLKLCLVGSFLVRSMKVLASLLFFCQ